MGFSASPQAVLLKSWVFSWCRSGQVLLRLLGVPSILLALYLEAKGASPKTTSRILSRLSRRLRLSTFICSSAIHRDRDNSLGDIFSQGRRDVMSTGAQSRNFDKARDPSGGSASSPLKEGSQSDSSTSLSPTPFLPNSQQQQDTHQGDMSSNSRSHNRSQTMSQVDIVRQGKRLSLQFPIQPSTGNTSPAFSPRSRPQSWVAAPSPVPSPETVSTPETNLLAVVAAQERYVLELKEELGKAEQDLKTLKKHFATQEAMKQRNEIRKVTQLQPLNTTLANYGADQDDEDGSALWMQKEMERRKAILSGTKSSQRKVFSGSKHLRTLSLLSPDKSYTPSFPQPQDLREHEEPATTASEATIVPKRNQHTRPPHVSRNSTNSDIANHIAHTVDGERNDLGGLTNMQRDALLRTGKQMATDFKDGLLTFIEDIRQATVGEEPIGGTEASGSAAKPRKPSEARPTLQRAASSRVSSKTGDIGDEFWKSHGLSEPKASPTNKRTHSLKHTRTPQQQRNQKHPLNTTVDDDEEWDNWDTPANTAKETQHAGDNSSDESLPSSPVSHQASSRTSTRYHAQRHDSKASLTTSSSAGLLSEDTPLRDAKRNSIPWPDLAKYSPSIKKTAATLMKQFEESLTPPAESRDMSHAQGDYIGRAISPASHSAQ
ncbi:hypothetical protein DM02DRAFT_611612 [Periconia macrospinosa]|uniref:DUF4048 domain-containing protein n=1 Tax=Periconia macrospinosa TaxID=97972 RepID=A0A2V1E2J4_9PLEO|nr:hypothetical protein DM02DRAFT_611612 [Periconia macrospinosa]